MPDPIRCEIDRSQTIPTYDCQPIEVRSAVSQTNQCLAEPNQSLRDGEEALLAEQEPTALPLAVQRLVKGATAQVVVVPGADVPVGPFLADHGLHCLGEVDAMAILMMGGANTPVLGFMAGFKVGWDVSKCGGKALDQERVALTNDAIEDARQFVEEDCVHGGGNANWQGNVLSCEVEQAP